MVEIQIRPMDWTPVPISWTTRLLGVGLTSPAARADAGELGIRRLSESRHTATTAWRTLANRLFYRGFVLEGQHRPWMVVAGPVASATSERHLSGFPRRDHGKVSVGDLTNPDYAN
jgi:hypothetical protein